jgi:hypothetical protein
MKRLNLLAMAVSVIALTASDAYCTPTLDYCLANSGIAIIAEGGTTDGTAHIIQVGGSDCNGSGGSGSAALCTNSNGNRGAYIDYSEKDLFAAALSAANTRNTSNARFGMVLVWEHGTGISTKGSTYSSTSACHLVSIGYM